MKSTAFLELQERREPSQAQSGESVIYTVVVERVVLVIQRIQSQPCLGLNPGYHLLTDLGQVTQ